MDELKSIAMLVQTSLQSNWIFQGSIVLHLFFVQILIAIVVAVIAVNLLPRKAQQQPRQRLLATIYYFVLSLFIPFGALWIGLVSVWIAKCFPLSPERKGIGEVNLPNFVPQLVSRVKYDAKARRAMQKDSPSVTLSERMTALAAMRDRKTKSVTPILRGLLSDSVEDVRLLVYAMLDSAEKELTKQIQLARLAESEATSDKDHLISAKRLAELYWELIYQNLVQDDIYAYTIGQAEKYAALALNIDMNDAGLWYIRARLALLKRDTAMAEQCLQKSIEQNFPPERLLPWQAEIAFLRGDYQQVRALFSQASNQSVLPLLKPLQRYWS